MTYRNATREHRDPPRQLTGDDWLTIQRLYDAGKLDLDIATAVGCSSKTISRWRTAESLPRNDRKRES